MIVIFAYNIFGNTVKIRYKLIFLLSFFALVSHSFAIDDYSAEIYLTDTPNDTIVNLGPCYLGDSLLTSFILKNTGSKTLKMLAVKPSFFRHVSLEELTPEQFIEFDLVTGLPLYLDSNHFVQFYVDYTATLATDVYPLGRKIALLDLGLVRANDTLQIVKIRHNFTLKAKKTLDFFDSFDDALNFDSVYINPGLPPRKICKMKNTWKENILAWDEKIAFITQPQLQPEFTITEGKIFPLGVISKGIVDWDVFYRPVDKLPDTAFLEISHKPKPFDKPDSLGNTKIKLTGIGVEQKLQIVESNFDFYSDTIDVGDVYAGVDTRVSFKIKNIGNLPFGALSPTSQYIYKQMTDTPVDGFTINQNRLHSGNHLLPDSIGEFEIMVNYNKRENFVVRYVIESDIQNRKIAGAPASARKVTFIIKGRCISPEILLNSNSINFEPNVILNPICPAKRDSVITIRNIGNETLYIHSAFTEPADIFQVEPNDRTIPPNSFETLKLTFSPKITGEAFGKLNLITNQAAPYNNVSVSLSGTAVSSVPAKIYMPPIVKSNAGRIIGIPIIITDKLVRNARTFDDTLYYNKTLLKFDGVETIGTASEGVLNSTATMIEEDSAGGKLVVSISTPSSKLYFLPLDTLIILKFKTFLGEQISTPIVFSKPLLGDGICSGAVLLNDNPGNCIFSLDSICGLPFKAFNRSSGYFKFDTPSPNPATSEIEIKYSVAFQTDISIEIYNPYGGLAATIINTLHPEGEFSTVFPVNGLSPGVYYCEMRAGIFRKSIPIVIAR